MEKIGGYNLVVIDTTKENEEGYAQKVFEELEEKTKYGKPLHVIYGELSECEVGYKIRKSSSEVSIFLFLVDSDGDTKVHIKHNTRDETYSISHTYSSPTYGHLKEVVALESGSSQIQADINNLSYGREFIIDFIRGATYGGSEVIPRNVRLKATSMFIGIDNSVFKFMYDSNGTIYFITMTITGNNASFSTSKVTATV